MSKKNKPKWKLWQRITVAIASAALVAGIGLLAFPTVSNFFGQQRANTIISDFNNSLLHVVPENAADVPGTGGTQNPADAEPSEGDAPPESRLIHNNYKDALEYGEIDSEGYIIDSDGERVTDYPVVFEVDLNTLRRDSLAYNKYLIDHQGAVDTSDYASAALDMSDYGLSNFYCYLSAPAIGLYMPVYLGANDEMMSYGAAHLAGTSLPVDQEDTNIALAGHTGYIGRIFFDNIRQLDIGDEVSISNYWEDIDFRVIDYKIVDENETADIYIQKGKRLLTLITCVTDDTRYLVICEKK